MIIYLQLITVKIKFSYTYHKSNLNILYPLTLIICTLFIVLNYNSVSKDIYNISVSNSVVLGNPNARITIIKWTDFQWPFCAKSVSLIDQILEKYPDNVKVVIKNFPLPKHKEAMTAARYALAAHKQNKYKEMYHFIFSNYTKLANNEDLPLKYAKKLGLDMEKFIQDFESEKILQQIELNQFLNNNGVIILEMDNNSKEFVYQKELYDFDDRSKGGTKIIFMKRKSD